MSALCGLDIRAVDLYWCKKRLYGLVWLSTLAEYIRQFVDKRFVAIGNSDVWHIGSGDVVASNALACIVWSQPVVFHLRARERKYRNNIV